MSDVKLKATIEGDSKPLQNALNQAGQSADQAAKTVSGRMNTAAGSMDRAGQSAAQMGTSGKTAAGEIADAMQRPIKAIQQVTTQARQANGELQAMGRTSQQVGQTAGRAGGDISTAIGVIGAKFAIVSKLITKVWNVGAAFIKRNIVNPLKEAGKATQEVAMGLAGKGDALNGKAEAVDTLQEALKRYYEVYEQARKSGTTVDWEKERFAREDINAEHRLDLDPSKGPMSKQIEDALRKSQDSKIKTLEQQVELYQRAVDRQKRAVEKHDKWTTQAAYGYENYEQYEADKDALVMRQQELEAKLKEAKGALSKARGSSPDQRFLAMVRASEVDAQIKQEQELAEARAKAAEEAEKAEEARAKAVEKGVDALDQWASELLDDDSQRRLDAAYEKYADLIEAGVSEEAAKPLLDEAIRQELTKAVEREAEAREGLVNEYLSARANLKTAIKHEQDARDALTKANADLAELKKRQKQDERLEAIDRKRSKIQSKLAGFGFSLNGSHLGESPAERRKRQMDARTDASIRRKLERSEAGRYVSFTEAEKSRLNEYNKLKKQDKALDKEAKAIRAADKQAAAAENLKSASSAIKSAAESLAVATGAREAAATEANQKRWNAENAAKKEQEARDRAATGVAGRSQKYSARLTAPPRNGIAGQAVKTKDYTGALDRIAQSLGKKIYVVK